MAFFKLTTNQFSSLSNALPDWFFFFGETGTSWENSFVWIGLSFKLILYLDDNDNIDLTF